MLRIESTGNMAACFEKQEKFKEAKDACTAVIAMQPNNLKALLRAARAATHQYIYNEASVCLQAANEYYPKNAEVQREIRALKKKVEEYRIAKKKQYNGMLLSKSTSKDESVKHSPGAISTQDRPRVVRNFVQPAVCDSVTATKRKAFGHYFSIRDMLSLVVLLVPTILLVAFCRIGLNPMLVYFASDNDKF
jgi:tetratricopeptide (TPR) repeat protein